MIRHWQDLKDIYESVNLLVQYCTVKVSSVSKHFKLLVLVTYLTKLKWNSFDVMQLSLYGYFSISVFKQNVVNVYKYYTLYVYFHQSNYIGTLMENADSVTS